jgi:hypothetical protein
VLAAGYAARFGGSLGFMAKQKKREAANAKITCVVTAAARRWRVRTPQFGRKKVAASYLKSQTLGGPELSLRARKAEDEGGAMSQCYLAIARSTTALILLVLAPSAAAALECYTSALRDNRHWSWRQVDGRRCWYPGLPGVSKSRLRWPKTSIAPSKDRQTSASTAAPPPSSQRDEEEVLLQSIWPPLSADCKSTLRRSQTSTPPSIDRQTNASAAAPPPPSSERDEEEVLLQSVWPPLSADSKSTPGWSKTSTPPPKDRQTNASAAAPPPSSQRDEEEVLLQSIWPPLSTDNFEERFAGAR